MSKEIESKLLEFINITQNNFDRIEGRFDNLEGRFDNLEERFDNLEGRFDNLQKSVVLIEDKVMTEFPALFEAFELHQEMHKDYEEKNSYLSAKVEEDSMRISVLEEQIKFLKNN